MIVVRDLATLVERARVLAAGPRRRVLGVTGPPGAGKSTLAAAVVAALGSERGAVGAPASEGGAASAPRSESGAVGAPGSGGGAVAASGSEGVVVGAPVEAPGSEARPVAALVPMDGFHLRQAVLVERGLATVKGAPETFDGVGYVALLRSWRSGRGELRAPGFDRVAEEPVPDAVVVPADVRLVVTEGNYLLLDSAPWSGLATVLDECWYVDLAEPLRVPRLVARHAVYGKSAADALAWATGSDARNAALVATTRERADVLVDLAALGLPEPHP